MKTLYELMLFDSRVPASRFQEYLFFIIRNLILIDIVTATIRELDKNIYGFQILYMNEN